MIFCSKGRGFCETQHRIMCTIRSCRRDTRRTSGKSLSNVDALSGFMPYLTESYPVFDMAPVTVNLYVIKLTVGLAFMPNFMSILGIVLALFLFRRY